ncbi:hypothetical protein HDU78_002970 [Chytriomyces hyalinus]|nr:hypothetical protein HDU78_002970 [Chytriomyces hyalinus]KAJ3249634.1 hypothetical protein HDU77_007645 [Chytriomyces hyalinus]
MDVSYTTANVISNMFRGMNMGLAFMLIGITCLTRRGFPQTTVTASLALGVLLVTKAGYSLLFDYLGLQGCLLRVKLIYGMTLLYNFAYWLFQANLAHRANSSSSKMVSGFSYIIGTALAVRVSINVYVCYRYTWILNPNRTCASVLDTFVNLADKLADFSYAFLLSGIYLYPLIMGYRETANRAPTAQQENNQLVGRTQPGKSQGRSGKQRRKMKSGIKGRQTFLKQILVDQGFILVLTCLLETAHVLCIITSLDPTVVGFWNAAFSSNYALFMTVHLLTTLRRRSTDSKAKTEFASSV